MSTFTFMCGTWGLDTGEGKCVAEVGEGRCGDHTALFLFLVHNWLNYSY